jgi:hypothetical protein
MRRRLIQWAVVVFGSLAVRWLVARRRALRVAVSSWRPGARDPTRGPSFLGDRASIVGERIGPWKAGRAPRGPALGGPQPFIAASRRSINQP